jgi:adenosylhomocysteinase
MADYAIKDLSLAEFGRREIAIAETEMPNSAPPSR